MLNREELCVKVSEVLYNYPTATMPEIADMIGVSKTSLYRIFASKRRFTEYMASKVFEMLEYNAKVSMEYHTNYPSALRRMMQNNFKYSPYGLLSTERTVRETVGDVHFKNGLQCLVIFFQRGIDARQFSDRISAQAMAAMFGIIGLGLIQSERRGVNIDDKAEVSYTFMMNGIRP